MALYDQIGRGYDTTRQADPGIVACLLRLLAVPAGSFCLDVACGTGNYTTALAQAGLSMVGTDVSRQMLTTARAKTDHLRWVQADAVNLPAADRAFHAAVCTMALHHFRAPAHVFREVRRVLDGGRLVLFTADPGQMQRYWLHVYFPDALARATRQMPPLDQTLAHLADAGFGRVTCEPWSVPPDLRDLFLYAGKYRPALYLDPRVRAGISTFANLAQPAEIEQGCARLAADIASGQFTEVLAASEHDAGDYLFIVAEA